VEPPPPEDLVQILDRTTTAHEPDVRAVADVAGLSRMIALTREVPIAAHLTRFVADIVAATHPDRSGAPELVRRYARFGSSPRGAQALVLAAKVTALLSGRLNVAEEDIRSVALPALRHRIILSYEALADEVSQDAIVEAVLASVPSPKEELEALG
ncbi:MAG: AAA family ATPase, partial [Actinomycetota bacterium]